MKDAKSKSEFSTLKDKRFSSFKSGLINWNGLSANQLFTQLIPTILIIVLLIFAISIPLRLI